MSDPLQTSSDAARVLVVNAGSSSVKIAIFQGGRELLRASAENVGGDGVLRIAGRSGPCTLPDHRHAVSALMAACADTGFPIDRIDAAAHRVVHGGRDLITAMRVTHDVLDEIERCNTLAPLHNPHNLLAMALLAELAPDLPQYASFDTAFHATIPDVAARYALPAKAEAMGLRRYGFHGTSYAALVDAFPRITGQPLPSRVLALHLGNGASLCAIKDGKSVATTMGYSPTSGLTMGTRSGDIDPQVVLRLASDMGIDAAGEILNKQAGLLGLSGHSSDMRDLLAASDTGSAFALDHFCYWACRHAGSMIAALQGLDAIVFTGGIGEHAAPIRQRISDGLGWLGAQINPHANDQNKFMLHAQGSSVSIWIIPAEEERRIAQDAATLIAQGQ